MAIQLKWNSQILNDFKQVFYCTSKIFKNPSDPMVSKEFALDGIWIACVIELIVNDRINYLLCALDMMSYFISFSLPILKTVFTLGIPFSLYNFEADIFLIEVTFIGDELDYYYFLLYPNISSNLSKLFYSFGLLSPKISLNMSYLRTGFIESLLGCGILKICFGHWPNSFIWHFNPILSIGSVISSIFTMP